MQRRKRQPQQQPRRGATIVLVALLIVVLLGMVAFGVDIGYILVVRTELQAAADSSAMAAAAVMDEESDVIIDTAKEFASLHKAGAKTVELENTDIEFGTWDSTTRTFTPTATVGNAIRVTARRDRSNSTGESPLFFGRVFGRYSFAAEASAVAMCNPRDIAFVVDLSGSMNDDTEPCWATGLANAEFAPDGYPTIGNTLMQQVYTDFGYGSFPGTLEHVGSRLHSSIPATTNAYKEMTKNNGRLTLTGLAAIHKILNSDSEATRRTKAYKWLIDKQIALAMPGVKPTPISGNPTSYAYWEKYLDYVIQQINDGSRGTLPPGSTWWKIDSFGNPNTTSYPSATSSLPQAYRNKIGYRTYVQFMMDHGRDMPPAGTTYTPLSLSNSQCPKHTESVAGESFQFPPREQPTHACRRSLITALQLIEERNDNIPDEDQRDWVSIITFDKLGGTNVPVIKQALTGDYDDAKAVCTSMQAVADNAASTATEAGLIYGKNHIRSTADGGAGRYNTQKVVVLLTDGMPNLYMSPSGDVDTYRTDNPSGDFYGGGSYAHDSALMQAAEMEGKKWMVFPVGIGLGTDYDFMDRCARMGGSANDDGESPRGSGNPAEYEQRLTEIFEEIINNPRVRLVQ